jgi:hypothetical protein
MNQTALCENDLAYWRDRFSSVEAERDKYADALHTIRSYDEFQGSPIAPRENPTTTALRRIASEALRENV